MIELDEEVAQRLTQVSLNSALQVRCGPRNAFAVTSSILTPLMQAFEMGGVYITASRSADEIATAMETVGVPTAPLHFLDLVSSGVLGGTSTSFPNISFVDSPIMLESILLRTLYHLRTTPYERNFVFIDSVNALSIYNDDRMLAEYLHTLINTFRQREILTVMLTIPDQTPQPCSRIWTCTARISSTEGTSPSLEAIEWHSARRMRNTSVRWVRSVCRSSTVR